MINLGITKFNTFLFECSACGNLQDYKTHIKHKCSQCGDVDTVSHVISYQWLKRPAGYSRLFPPDGVKNALASIKRAEASGVVFSIKTTFAGMRATVVSIPPPSPTIKKLYD